MNWPLAVLFKPFNLQRFRCVPLVSCHDLKPTVATSLWTRSLKSPQTLFFTKNTPWFLNSPFRTLHSNTSASVGVEKEVSAAHHVTAASISVASHVFKAVNDVAASMLRLNATTDPLRLRKGLLKTPITLNIKPASSSFSFTLPPEVSSVEMLNQLSISSSPSIEWFLTNPNEVTASLVSPISASEWFAAETAIQLFVNHSRLPISFLNQGANNQQRAIKQKDSSIGQPDNLTSSVLITPMSMPVLESEEREEEVLEITDASYHSYNPTVSALRKILPEHRSLKAVVSFLVSFVLNFRFYMIYMARTTFQAVRPLLAFCVFGEAMKLALAMMSSGTLIFLFSFVLAFEVLYFFLQCYISYVFLGMFFSAAF